MLSIPIQAAQSQTLNVRVGGQQCNLKIYELPTGLYMDVAVDNAPICTGVLCHNLNKIVRLQYLNFIGDFAFDDTQGSTDPIAAELGTRYRLLYISEDEL